MQPQLPWFLTRNPVAAKLQWQQERLTGMKRKLLADRIHLEHCLAK